MVLDILTNFKYKAIFADIYQLNLIVDIEIISDRCTITNIVSW